MNTDEKLNQSSMRNKKKKERNIKDFAMYLYFLLNNTVSIMILKKKKKKNRYRSRFYPRR